MRILIPGIDGYLGWALAQYLAERGHQVGGVDAGFRRQWVQEMGSRSAIPIAEMPARLAAFEERWGQRLFYQQGDLTDWDFIQRIFKEFRPEAIIHLGQCPSAPYSMIDRQHAVWVQTNNIMGNLNMLYAMHELAPEAHLVKLGTMGEYGTPAMDIPEGFFEVEFRGKKDRLPFPRQAGSWYHQSKVHDSNNTMLACKIWGLRVTDIMQGVVYGTRVDGLESDERLFTRLDFDEAFGTAINRFACQAVIAAPLTLYGSGHQKRGFLPLRDSLQCLALAVENPPLEGEDNYRVFNMFEEVYNVVELAGKVASAAAGLGLNPQVRHIENPRLEMEEHYYRPDRQHLLDLGYQPTHDMEAELRLMLTDLLRYSGRIEEVKEVLLPRIRWDGSRRQSTYLD